jgi:hypothetical protein
LLRKAELKERLGKIQKAYMDEGKSREKAANKQVRRKERKSNQIVLF